MAKDPIDLQKARARGKNIKTVREAAGLIQDEMAELLGVSPQTVSAMETGGNRNTNIDRLEAVAQAAFSTGNIHEDPQEIVRFILGLRNSITSTFRNAIGGDDGIRSAEGGGTSGRLEDPLGSFIPESQRLPVAV